MEKLDKIKLPFSTSAVEKGPIVVFENDILHIKYDSVNQYGLVNWVDITFQEVLFMQFSQIACCKEEQIINSDSICCYTDTKLLIDMLDEWEDSVGWQEWQQKQGGAGRFKHYRIFFDDVGCIDVISSQIRQHEVSNLHGEHKG